MGRHSGYDIGHKKSGIARGILVTLTIAVTGTAALGFIYMKSLEGRMHSNGGGIEKARQEMAVPLPDQPVNFLLVGSDSRGEDKGRADTLMVLRINPEKKRAYVLSIPRDMRVKIPSFGRNKINAAYPFGGVPLTIRTVKEFTGLDIHHFVEVDFQGFKALVDTLGGVDVRVGERLYDRRSVAFQVDIAPGQHHFGGEEALKYVRFRHDKQADFGRIQRQQEFLRAAMGKLLRLRSIAKVPSIAGIVADNTKTDLSIAEMVSWGRLLGGFERTDVQMAMLPGRPKNLGGISYVMPEERAMEDMLDAVVSDHDLPTGSMAKTAKRLTRAKVEVWNGTKTSGLARRVADDLRRAGFRIGKVSNADHFEYERTEIIYQPERENEAKKLKRSLGTGEVVPASPAYPTTASDVLVLLGNDYSS